MPAADRRRPSSGRPRGRCWRPGPTGIGARLARVRPHPVARRACHPPRAAGPGQTSGRARSSGAGTVQVRTAVWRWPTVMRRPGRGERERADRPAAPRLDLEGADVAAAGAVAVAVLRPRLAPLVGLRAARVCALVDRRTAGQQGMGWRWAAVILERSEPRVGEDQVAVVLGAVQVAGVGRVQVGAGRGDRPSAVAAGCCWPAACS